MIILSAILLAAAALSLQFGGNLLAAALCLAVLVLAGLELWIVDGLEHRDARRRNAR